MLRVMLVAILATLILLAAILASAPDASARACARPSAAKIASLPREYPRFYRALRSEFRGFWREAAIVSWGEGSWHWWARNGQYRGTFQMGSRERDRWGHGNTLVAQVVAAARYFWWAHKHHAHGRWGPWECKP